MKKHDKWGIITLLSILFIELLLDNIVVTNNLRDFYLEGNYSVFKLSVLGICFFLLLVSVIINRRCIWHQKQETNPSLRRARRNRVTRMKDILKTLIKNSVSGNAIDILFVMFFLLHINWIPGAIFDLVKAEPERSSLFIRAIHPFIYIFCLLEAIRLKPSIPIDDNSDIKVMLTGISNIGVSNLSLLLKPLKKYPTIERVIVFVDTTIAVSSQIVQEWKVGNERIDGERAYLKEYGITDKLIEDISKFKECGKSKQILEKFLCDIFKIETQTELEVTLVDCNYSLLSDLNRSVIKAQMNLKTKDGSRYPENSLLFNLTPGNKLISIALAINSIKGDKKYCYVRQDTSELEPGQIDISEIRDTIEVD